MTICPRNAKYVDSMVHGIPLKVIQSDGVDMTPHIKFTEAELDNGAKYFHNDSGKADSFKVKVIINSDETVAVDTLVSDSTYEDIGRTKNILTVLDYFIRNAEPFYITTRAVGINNQDLWMVTGNPSRKQKYDNGYVEWDLTFTKFVGYSYAVFKNTNTGVANALNKYKKKKATAKKTAKKKAKTKTAKKSKFEKNCNASQLKYSTKKKVVPCVKQMQQILHKKGCYNASVDGWYYKETKKGVKKFQKKYAKKYKLKQTGNIDKNTFNALCKV